MGAHDSSVDRYGLARKAAAVLGAGILGVLIGAGPAGATSTAPTGPAETQCVRGENVGAGESATNKTPYDPKTITVGIHQANLSHQASPNHITMEIVVRNKNKSPTCAAYPVYLTFNPPGGDPQTPRAVATNRSTTPRSRAAPTTAPRSSTAPASGSSPRL